MDFFENYYYRTSRTFMLWIGQWPYDTSNGKQIRRALISLVILSGLQMEISKLLTTEFDLDIYVEAISGTLICLASFAKYCIWWFNGSSLRKLLQHIKHDWDTITGEDEVKVIVQYTNYGRIFGIVYLSAILSGITFAGLLVLSPRFLDILFPLNESRPMRQLIQVEHFIDKEKYFYPIYVHIFIVVYVSHFISGAADWFYIYFIMHACATFNILGTRMERLFDKTNGTIEYLPVEKTKIECKYCTEISRCVDFHRRLIDYVDLINGSYIPSTLLQLFFAVLILTALLLRLYDKLNPLRNINEVIPCAIQAGGFIFVIFLNVYPAQMLMDASASIFFQVYNSRWYYAPVRVQKLLLLMMHKCMEPCKLTAANVITASLQIFATIVQTSLSYFTVLYTLK